MLANPACLALLLLFGGGPSANAADPEGRGLRGPPADDAASSRRRLPKGGNNKKGAVAPVSDASVAGNNPEDHPNDPIYENEDDPDADVATYGSVAGVVLTGNVIVSRKSEKKLRKEGKSKNAIKSLRDKGKKQIRKNEVVFEGGGEDDDFQVVKVPKGQEKKFARDLMRNDAEGLFEYAEPETIESLVGTDANDPLLANQYHHALMRSAQAWDLTTGLASVTVGICDTGLELNHPDLAANRLPGYHATAQCWEDDPTCTADVSAVHPHGTQCAGCAAALGNNAVGVSGVGWSFMHRPGRVSDSSGGGASSAVLADCAMRMCEKPDVKVVSVSYSGVEAQSRRAAATHCKAHGALMVNAAGNDGRDLTQFGDADADDLIVAGASTSADLKSGFSAYGSFVDVWAPGSSVWTTTTGNTYRAVSGTSFSCPLVAGLIALIWSKNPELTPDEVETILKQSTNPTMGDGTLWTTKGTTYGRIDSFAAVNAAGSGTLFPTQSPTTAPPTSSPTRCTDDMCDDGNSCTIDTCSTLDQSDGRLCNHAPVPNCCGNDICEFDSGENESTCLQDCNPGPFAVAAPRCSGSCYIRDGAMFDVVAKNKDLTVKSIKFYFYTGTIAEVWTRAGTFQGFTTSSTGWTKVAEHDFTGTGAWQLVQFPEETFTATDIAAGERQSFYVTLRTDGNLLYGKAASPSYNGIIAEDDRLVVHEGNVATYSFGSGFGPRAWGGEIVYTVNHGGGAPEPITPPPTTALPTPLPTPLPTVPSPTDAPTPNPTPSPTDVPTPNPTPSPTDVPTPSPTPNPTDVPTPNPTNSPTTTPTSSPTLTLSPSVFQPEVVELSTGPTSSAYILRSHYFQVEGGNVDAKITDLQITTYGTNELHVYSKVGDAAPYEQTPCSWKLVAKTASSYSPSSWRKEYPTWDADGFDPVLLPANTTVSFYVVNMGTSYGILGTRATDLYTPWISTPLDSPVGEVIMTSGRIGYANEPFRPYSTSSKYAIYGGIKLETVQPGTMTPAPTMAPTAMLQPGSLDSPTLGTNLQYKGLQFDVDTGSNDVLVRQFGVILAATGSHHVEVWMRSGSHQGTSGGCSNWNNWCSAWTRLTSSTVTSMGSTSVTSTGTFVAHIEAESTAAFAIISGTTDILTTEQTAAVQNGDLKINQATPVEDYYGNNVQTIYGTLSPSKLFQGSVIYDVANSRCAILSTASWVVLNPASSVAGASVAGASEAGDEEPEFATQYGEEEDEEIIE